MGVLDLNPREVDLDLRNPDVIRKRIEDLDRQISHAMRRVDIAQAERDELHALLEEVPIPILDSQGADL